MAFKAQLKVLVVDDQRTSRMLINDALDQIGIRQIAFAADGEEALKMMMTAPSHVVISDFNMPKLDGLQLLKAIRAFPATKKTPFFILTG
ncbi:MAG: response regulator, partial [Hyphomicrobiales bacterium]